MAYGDFNMLIKFRGATEIERIADTKSTKFLFEGKRWMCTDKMKRDMSAELANGYEMNYCLKLYCEVISI